MRLHDYLRRIGLDECGLSLQPTLDSLRRLHLAHREVFLFDNVTIQTGGRISLALGDLEQKFLDDRRGGYCFEHNTLFAAALRAVGFRPATLLGRVRRGPPDRWCRTHMILRVPIGAGGQSSAVGPGTDDVWLADVGFGAVGTLEPMPLADGARAVQTGFEYAIRREEHLWILSMRDAAGAWQDLYEFTDDPQTPWDVEVANHFTSTHPESVFRRTLTIQRSRRAERVVLRSDVLEHYRDGQVETAMIDRGDWPRLARELFDLDLPAGPFVCESYAASLVGG